MKLPTSLKRAAQAVTIALSWGYVCLAVPYATEPVAVRWTVWYFHPPNEAYSLGAILATNLLDAALALVLAVLVVSRLPERARQVVGAVIAVLSAALCVVLRCFRHVARPDVHAGIWYRPRPLSGVLDAHQTIEERSGQQRMRRAR